jgi:hypothetical protein
VNALLLSLLVGAAPTADAAVPAVPCAACITWEVTRAQAEHLAATPGSLEGLEVLLRPAAHEADPADLLRALSARGARVGLIVTLMYEPPAGARVAGRVVIEVDHGAGADLDRLAFEVKTLATEMRAGNPAVEVGMETGPDVWDALDARGLGPYLDFRVESTRPDGASRAGGPPVWARTGPVGAVDLGAASPYQRRLARAPEDDGRTLLAARALAEVLPQGLTPLSSVEVSCPKAPGGCESRVFLHPATLDAVAIVVPRGPVRDVTVSPTPRQVELIPLDTNVAAVPSVLSQRAALSGAQVDVPPDFGAFILRIRDWSGDGLDRFASGVEVVAERPLTVDEVVARHQAAAARQRALVRRLISSGSMVATFRVPGLAAPMTLTSDVVVYDGDGSREIEQRSVRLNGVGYSGGTAGLPRVPLLEPERVTAPPLAITLGATYRYRLVARDTVEGQDCYVVAFEPMGASRRLLRGRVWIAARGFAMVRAEAVQTGLRGPIVSAQQRDVFTAVPVGETVAWLLSRSEVHQVYEGPGHRTPIDRVLALTRLEANPLDFAARRAAAHASESVLVAETAEGLRYLRRTPAAPGAPDAVPSPRQNAGTGSRVRTVALGVLVDPNISRPLPFAGLSYLDLDFLGTGAQVNAFFGGAFAQLAWTVPSLGGSRWQAHGSGFAVLASYNDRAFSGGLERYEENLRQRPARLALGVARPLGDATRLRVDYELEYTRLARADTTAAEFVVPVNPVVHGIRVALEAQRGPWSASAWWNGARRQRWAPWGLSASEAGAAGFQRFGASAARSFVLSPGAVARLDAAWMAGRGLDRFSRFAFDGFENRLRGYPSATIRYDHGGVVRGALTWNAGKRVRLDGFLDAARVRDPGSGPRPRTYLGVGAGFEAPLPLQFLASVEWGYGVQARGGDGGTGTHVVRVTAYKVF